MAPGPLLAFDTGSAIVSVALALPEDGETGSAGSSRIDTLAVPRGQSSRELISMIDQLLGRAGLRPAGLVGIGAAAGPGSFTGLRVGLATALGLHQAAGVPAGAVPTFELLAAWHAQHAPSPGSSRVLAAVDAHRDRWFVQPHEIGTDGTSHALAPPRIADRAEVEASELPVVGHGVSALSPGAGAVEARHLAPVLVQAMTRRGFLPDAATLVAPLYLRPPATSAARRPPGSPRKRTPRPAV